MDASRFDPTRYEHLDVTPTQAPVQPEAPQQPQSGNLLNQIGGMAQGVGNFIAPARTKAITQGPGQILNAMAKQPKPQGNILQRIPQAFSNAAQSTGELAKVVGNPGVVAETGVQALLQSPGQATGLMKLLPKQTGLPFVANQLEAGGQLLGAGLKHLTKGSAAKATERAADKATQQGAVTLLREFNKVPGLFDQIEEAVAKRYGKGKDVTNVVGKLLKEQLPADMNISSAMTPTQQLAWRRQLLNKYGTSIIEKLLKGTSIEEKVAGTVRGTVSKSFHKAVPETVPLDKLMTFYSSKFGGDLPTLIKKYGWIPFAKGAVQNYLTNPIRDLTAE